MKLRNHKCRLSLIGLPLLACAAVSPVYAIDFSSNALYRYQTTDNIDRVAESEGETDGATHEIIGEFSGSTRAQNLDLDFDLSLGLSEGNGIESVQNSDIRASLYALFNLRPGQISWLLADYAVEQGNDLAQLADRDERFLTNYFITGPSTSWRITPVDTLNVDLFYLLGDQEDDPEQTRQLALRTDWSHRFSRTNTMGLHFENTDISFKESDDEFGIQNIFARYTYAQGKTLLDVDVGRSSSTDFEPVDNSETSRDEDLFRIGFSRQMSRSTAMTLSGSQKFTDETFSTVRDLQANLDAGLNTGLGPFYEKRFALGVNRGGNIWNAGLELSNTNLEFVDETSQEDDRAETRATFDLGYALTSVWGLRLTTGLADIKYDNVVRQDDEVNYSIGVSYQISAAWGTSLDAFFDSIESNRPNDETGIQEDVVIDERGISFGLYWQPITKLTRLREKFQSQGIENVLK